MERESIKMQSKMVRKAYDISLSRAGKLGYFPSFLLLLFAFLVSCGGPKKLVFDVEVKLNRPEAISESDYRKLLPVVQKSKVEGEISVKSEEGTVVFQKKESSNPQDGKVSFKFSFDVDDFSSTADINVSSKGFLIFSKNVFSDKLEKVEELPMCVEGDVDEVGYDYMCKIRASLTPNVSEHVKTYIKIREELTGVKEEDFCNVYVASQKKVNSLPPGIREVAMRDVQDIYNSFLVKVSEKVKNIEDKVNQRNCADHKEIKLMRNYFCLTNQVLAKLKDMDVFCDALALYEQGKYELSRGRTIKALDKFREAIKVRPDFPDPYIAIGDIYFDEKRYDDAVDMYRKAIENAPGMVEPYVKLADTYFKMKDYRSAEEILRKAIDISGEKAGHELFFKRALALSHMYRWEQAIEPARRAVDMLENSDEVKYNRELQKLLARYKTLLGKIYMKLGRNEEAIRELKDAVENYDPFAPEPILYLAQIYSQSEEKKDLKQARRYYEKLFTLDTDFSRDGEVWFKFATLLEKLEVDESEVASALERVVKYSKKNPDAYFKLAQIYRKRKGYERVAEENYKKAYETAEEKEKKSQYLIAYVQYLIERGKYGLAKKVIEDYLSKNKDDKLAKQKYNDAIILLFKINPATLRRLRIRGRMIDEIYSAFSGMSPEVAEMIRESVGISKEVFDRLDPLKKFALTVFYMDMLFGKKGRGARIQKAEKYKELFGKVLRRRTINRLARINSDMLGLKLVK